jgi:hypothetical protein
MAVTFGAMTGEQQLRADHDLISALSAAASKRATPASWQPG